MIGTRCLFLGATLLILPMGLGAAAPAPTRWNASDAGAIGDGATDQKPNRE